VRATAGPTRCRVVRAHPGAIVPTKANPSDVGYDITVIRAVKKLNGAVTLYDTGLKIGMDPGFYAEIVPRSSLSKSGFVLANSMGIIDPSYTGNLLVALARVDADAPEPALPFRCCQLIVRPQIHAIVSECSEIDATVRGDGGFGSTGGVAR
jgi:dUTP pyrophosphatase